MGLSAQQLSQPLRLGHLRGDPRRLLRCLERPHEFVGPFYSTITPNSLQPKRGAPIKVRTELDFADFVRLFQMPAQKIDASAMMRTACSTGAAVCPKGPNGIHRSFQSDQ